MIVPGYRTTELYQHEGFNMERKQSRYGDGRAEHSHRSSFSGQQQIRAGYELISKDAERCKHSRFLGASSALALMTGVCVCV